MKSTERLYGDVPLELVYERKAVCHQFILHAERAYAEIASKDVKTDDDIARALEIREAIKFNQFIIDEV